MKKKHTLAARWSSEDSARQLILDRARMCAALTLPEVLPREGQSKESRLPDNFQSLGATGVTTLVGKLMMVLYPPDMRWIEMAPAARLLHDKSIPDEQKQLWLGELFIDAILVQKSIEEASGTAYSRSGGDFRSNKQGSLTQLVVTGDSLEFMDDDLNIRWFRRDMYTTERDSAGWVVSHMTNEKIDPLTQTDDVLNECNLDKSDLTDQSFADRVKPLITRVEWQPFSRTWVIQQELNEVVFNEFEREFSPYFCTAARLVCGENYGRGPVEAKLGDLWSYDYFNQCMLDWAGICSKMIPAIDYGSPLQEEELAQRSGRPIRARVLDGQIVDVGFLKVDKAQDFGVVYQVMEAKRMDLARAMLIESEITPQQDRVTATQIMRLARELDGQVGGTLASISGQQQRAMVDFAMHTLRKKKVLRDYDSKLVDVTVATGLATLSRENKLNRLTQAYSIVAQLGPDVLAVIDRATLARSIFRQAGVDEPGIVKTDEQMKREAEQAIAQQTQLALGEEGAKVLGDVARNRLIPQQ